MILVEANSTATSSKGRSFKDVTFHAPVGNAAAADHTSAAPPTSAAPSTNAATPQAEVDREVAAPADTNQTAHGELGLDNGQSCDEVGKEDVELGQDKGEWEEVAILEDVVGDLKVLGAVDKEETVILSQGTVKAMEAAAMEWDVGPSCSLFQEGTEDYEWFKSIPDSPSKPLHTPSCVDASPDVQQPVSAGPTFDNTPQLARQSNTSEIPVDHGFKLPVPTNISVPCFDTDPKLPRSTDTREPIFDVSPISFAMPLVSSGQQSRPEVVFREPRDKNVEASSGRSIHEKKAIKKRTASLSSVFQR